VTSFAALALLTVTGLYILEQNNSAWVQAGKTSNRIRASLQTFYSFTPGDPQVLIVGLPDTIHGAYVVRNGLPGMTKRPQMIRDINNALMLNKLEPVLPLGYFKNSMAENHSDANVLAWNPHTQSLNKIDTALFLTATAVPNAAELLQSLKPSDDSCKLSRGADGAVELTAMDRRRHPLATVAVSPDLNCFNTNFIAIKANVINAGDGSGLDLFYKNRIVPDFELYHRVHVDTSATGPKTWLFSLHAVPDWTLGEQGQLQLRLPKGSDIKIESVEIIAPETVMPRISFANSGFLGTKGFAHLSSSDTEFELNYDASKVAGAAAVGIEITRPNLNFEEDKQNTADKSKVVLTQIICPSKHGTIKIGRTMTPQVGLYELRPFAVDKHGARLGVSGDHIVISVDS
jgi:hypothetical protein